MRYVAFIIILIFLLAGFFLNAQAVVCKPGFSAINGVCFPNNTGLSSSPVRNIIVNLMDWLLGIFSFLAVISFIISGIQYLTSAGDEKSVETAKRNMKWSIIGVVVGLSGLIIVQAVNKALNLTPLF